MTTTDRQTAGGQRITRSPAGHNKTHGARATDPNRRPSRPSSNKSTTMLWACCSISNYTPHFQT